MSKIPGWLAVHWKTAALVAVGIGVLLGLSRFLFFRDIGNSMEQQQELRKALQNRPRKNSAKP